MKKEVIYTRFSGEPGLDREGQRKELLARLGREYEIVSEVSDVASGTQEIQDRPGLKKLLEDAAKGDVEVLFCSDITRLTRSLPLEIIGALQKAGVQIVTADGIQIGFADLIANTLINQMPKTFVEAQSQRIKAGIRAARERRDRKADGSSSE